jgi:hypothetical protein
MNTLSDVTLHVDENLNRERRIAINGKLKAIAGVADVLNTDHKPHLTVVRYDAAKATADDILATLRGAGVHAEMIGL